MATIPHAAMTLGQPRLPFFVPHKDHLQICTNCWRADHRHGPLGACPPPVPLNEFPALGW